MLQMTQTTIYLSVNRGSESLILDGNLSLVKELLTTLNAREREQEALAANLPAEDPQPEPKQEAACATA